VPGKKLSDQTRTAEVLPTWAERVVAAMSLFGSPGAPDDDVDAAVQAWHLLRDLRKVELDTDDDDLGDSVVDHRPQAREPAYA
jgi:phage terminase large subunit-like protein